jgi:hypothetical protein
LLKSSSSLRIRMKMTFLSFHVGTVLSSRDEKSFVGNSRFTGISFRLIFDNLVDLFLLYMFANFERSHTYCVTDIRSVH